MTHRLHIESELGPSDLILAIINPAAGKIWVEVLCASEAQAERQA